MIRMRILAATGLVFLIVIVLTFYERETQSTQVYLLDASSGITIEEAENATQLTSYSHSEDGFFYDNEKLPVFSENNQQTSPASPRISVFDGRINPNTLKFFRYLHRLFSSSSNLEDHLEFVLKRLKSQLSDKDAKRILKIYQDYLQCEIDLAAESAQWTFPNDSQQALDLLIRIQEYRRKALGVEMADALFGAEVKASEYAIRRSLITKDQELYGVEKEQKLEFLNRDMWGDEAEDMVQKPKPYHRYREKLEMYAKDIKELSGDEREERIAQFRRSFFSAEVISKLEAVDSQVEKERAIEEEYFQDEAKIMTSPDLTAEEKEYAVLALQEDAFGDQAESFRRRESIRKGLEALKTKAKSSAK